MNKEIEACNSYACTQFFCSFKMRDIMHFINVSNTVKNNHNVIKNCEIVLFLSKSAVVA